MRIPPSAVRPVLAALLVLGTVAAATGGVYGAFFATTANPSSPLSAKRIFPGDRTTSAWSVTDAADGTAADVSDPIAFADSLSKTTKSWATTWSATRYLDFDFFPSRAAGLAVSGASFDLRYRPATAGDSVCFYFEVRSASSDYVIATYGSSGAPVACVTGASYTTVSTPIPAVSTTELANDLRIRTYMRNATAERGVVVDAATVSGTTYEGFTLYPALQVDRADGTVQTGPWSLATASDGAYLLTARWATAYDPSRWVEFAVNGFVPAGATVTGARLTHAYKTNFNSATVCYYLETYSGGALIGSHGSTSSDISCTSTAWQTDTIPLPEVDSVARANDLVVRVYAKSSTGGGRESQHEVVGVTFTYELD